MSMAFGQIYLSKPNVKEIDGTNQRRGLIPNEARLRNLTYVCTRTQPHTCTSHSFL
jgi:hypothetical protein